MTFSLLLLSIFTFVELNCENLFDCRHDSLKNDTEFLPDGSYHWTPYRYWRKLDRIGQTIIACGEDRCGENLKDKEKENGSGWNWKLPDLWRCARWRTTASCATSQSVRCSETPVMSMS